MDLHVWPGNKGIESFDSDSLVVLTYLRLGKCPINIHNDISSASDLENTPLLQHGSNQIKEVSKIIEYLRTENYGIEYHLSDEEQARLKSLVASVERRITPACRWLLWGDYNAYSSYTYPLYRKPFNYIYGLWLPSRWRRSIVKQAEFSQLTNLGSTTPSNDRNKEIESSLFEGARRCLTALSYVLGEKNFFLTDKPSAIDAFVFARLWPLLNYDRVVRKADSNAHRLVAHIYQCNNLVALCRRVQRLCFPQANDSFRSAINVDISESSKTPGSRRAGLGGWFSFLFNSPTSLIPTSHTLDGLIFGALVLGVTTVFVVGTGIVGVTEDDGGHDRGTEFDDDIDED